MFLKKSISFIDKAEKFIGIAPLIFSRYPWRFDISRLLNSFCLFDKH